MVALLGWLNEDLPLPRADAVLLVHSFATAIVDTFTFPSLQVFVANQTGNVIFLGLSIAGLQLDVLHADRSILALISFWIGSFVTGRVGNRLGTKKRYYLFSIFLLQAVLIFLASGLIYAQDVQLENTSNLALIAPMAFAFGSQAAASRPLGVPLITTVVVTSAMVDLFADPQFFTSITANKGRNQRAAFIVFFFVGGIVGGLCLKYVNGGFTLLLAAIIKTIGAVLFLFAKGVEKEKVKDLAAKPVELYGMSS